jgi:phosphoribosylglycinamide formyltransferase-1
MSQKIRIGILISGSGTNMQAIVDSSVQERIQAEVVVVGADRQEATGLDRARRHGIPTFVVDYGDIIHRYRSSPSSLVLPPDFDIDALKQKQTLFTTPSAPEKVTSFLTTRALAENRLLEHLSVFNLDLLVLAGFMRNLTPYFIDRFNTDPNRPCIMNIHPALLPAFPGVDGYGDAYRHGCKVAGCTVHFIDYGEDSGPIIAQKSFAIEEDDTLIRVREKGLALEWEIYPECIQLFAEGRLQLVTLTHTPSNGNVIQRRVVKIVRIKE